MNRDDFGGLLMVVAALLGTFLLLWFSSPSGLKDQTIPAQQEAPR